MNVFPIDRPGFAATKTDQKANLTLNPAQVMKILNVNAAAKHLTENYTGPLVEPSAFEFQFGYRKTKKALIDGLIDTSKNLFNSESNIRTGFDTGMGFVIGKHYFYFTRTYFQPDNNLKTSFFFL